MKPELLSAVMSAAESPFAVLAMVMAGVLFWSFSAKGIALTGPPFRLIFLSEFLIFASSFGSLAIGNANMNHRM